MEPSDQSNGSKSLNDVMYRRLKNRERQRRYRERKRLQANVRKGRVDNESSSQLQIVPVPTNGTAEQVVTRVHCTRDWKKDARRVHATKQEAISNSLSSNGPPSSAGEKLSSGMQAEQTSKNEVSSTNGSSLDNHEKTRSKSGRRDWKAEARNKNSRSS